VVIAAAAAVVLKEGLTVVVVVTGGKEAKGSTPDRGTTDTRCHPSARSTRPAPRMCLALLLLETGGGNGLVIFLESG